MREMMQLVRVMVGGRVAYVNRDLVAALKEDVAGSTDVLLSGSGIIRVEEPIDILVKRLTGEKG